MSERLRWVANTWDPSKPDADMYVARSHTETQKDAVRHYHDWLNGKVIGEPQATEAYTVEQLKAMDLVGVYVRKENA